MFINWRPLKAIHLMKFRVKCKVITEYKVLTFGKNKMITSQIVSHLILDITSTVKCQQV